MKKTCKNLSFLLAGLLIDVVLIFSIYLYFYADLPDMMASHWNAAGEVNGYISRFWGLFLMPIVAYLMLFLFWIIPKVDPLKKNIDDFRKEYNSFVVLMVLFLVYIHAVSLIWNFGYEFNMGITVVPAIAVLFIFISRLLEVSKRNWFIGIRTPWTLSDDVVWNKTHKLAAKLFRIVGVLMLLGSFFQEGIVWVVLISVVVIVIVPVVYSYFEYKKIHVD